MPDARMVGGLIPISDKGTSANRPIVIAHREVIWIEHESMSDAPYWPLLARALREFADKVEALQGRADPEQPDIFDASNGVRLTSFFGTWLGELVPDEVPYLRRK